MYEHDGGHDRSTPLHEERLDAVATVLISSGASSVIDLGCGPGALLQRLLVERRFSHLLGVDTSAAALMVAERRLDAISPAEERRWSLEHASFMEPARQWRRFEAAAMVETVEHVPPGDLSRLERSVFALTRPELVVITTPNRDYNVHFGLRDDEFRHPDHRFEWSRAKFHRWARGVAERNGYTVRLQDVGRADALLGAPSQMAVFTLQ
ncbi:MAG: methyltransferase domain-containing protein [Gemmatimonadota bacterium]